MNAVVARESGIDELQKQKMHFRVTSFFNSMDLCTNLTTESKHNSEAFEISKKKSTFWKSCKFLTNTYPIAFVNLSTTLRVRSFFFHKLLFGILLSIKVNDNIMN
ncbi:hypothetical protein MS3_00000029, partial [Schistosoma haematobium]